MFNWLLTLDWSVLSLLAVGISFGYGKSNSQQQSQSTGPVSGQVRDAQQALLNQTSYSVNRRVFDPLNTNFQPITPTPLSALSAEGFYPGQERVNAMGLYGGQQQGFEEAVRQVLGQLSGNFADRGFNTPRTVNAIAGSAAQNVLPQFAPLMGQQIAGQNALAGGQLGARDTVQLQQDQLRNQLSLLPEEVRLKKTQQFLEFMNALSTSLGGQSTGFGQAKSFNVSGSIDPKAAAAAAGAICWIAGVLYGEGSDDQRQIRHWLLWQAHRSRRWAAVVWLYQAYGQTIARHMPQSRMLTWSMRLIFTSLKRRAWQMT